MTTLNKNTGLFVYVTQDTNGNKNLSLVGAGWVDPVNDYVISLNIDGAALYDTGNYSVDPIITRLSDTSFAILYYSYEPVISLYTKYGTVPRYPS